MRSDFEPERLKKARMNLEKHLRAARLHADTNEGYKRGVLKPPTLWEKFKKLFTRK